MIYTQQPTGVHIEEAVRQFNEQMGLKTGSYSGSSGGSSGGSSSSYDYDDEEPSIDIEAEYIALKKSGAGARELDNYLKSAISEGYITSRDATELRDKRY